jgi:hypothetical protein
MDKAFIEEQIGIVSKELVVAEQQAFAARVSFERATANYNAAKTTTKYLTGLLQGLKDELSFMGES